MCKDCSPLTQMPLVETLSPRFPWWLLEAPQIFPDLLAWYDSTAHVRKKQMNTKNTLWQWHPTSSVLTGSFSAADLTGPCSDTRRNQRQRLGYFCKTASSSTADREWELNRNMVHQMKSASYHHHYPKLNRPLHQPNTNK